MPALPPHHRKLVAEVVMVRLFFCLENRIASIGAKMLCGAPYVDATAPLRLVTPRSIPAAIDAMKTHGRGTPKTYLKWTKGPDIRDNLGLTLDLLDPFFGVMTRHAAVLTEMRNVRNHIAHGSSSTRAKFRNVVRQYYGGVKQGVTPGLLLLTGAFGPPCLLDRYIVSSRVIIRDALRA